MIILTRTNNQAFTEDWKSRAQSFPVLWLSIVLVLHIGITSCTFLWLTEMSKKNAYVCIHLQRLWCNLERLIVNDG